MKVEFSKQNSANEGVVTFVVVMIVVGIVVGIVGKFNIVEVVGCSEKFDIIVGKVLFVR